MRILLVSQYFWPETFIINDLVRQLTAQGHDITVLTGKPNYPEGRIMAGYTRKGVTQEWFHGAVRVLRAPLRPRGQGAFDLVRNYLSFVVSGLLHFPRMAKSLEPEVILVFAPSPITSAVPAIALRWIKGAHLAVWVQDLWPESLAATGYVRNRALLRMAQVLVRLIYRCCDTLLVQSRAFEGPVAQLADPRKIVYYPNSVADPGDMPHAAAPAALPAELVKLLDGHFCAVFAGNIGTAQAVETLVETAWHLLDLKAFRLVLVGSGSRLDWVREECARRGIHNVVLAGRFPMGTMPAIFARAGVLLVTLRKDPIFSYTIPSKVQAYMAAGRPIAAALDGEGARIIEDAGAGPTCPAEDHEALARSLRKLHAMLPGEREKLGQAARNYFLQHFEMSRLSGRLIEILQSRIQKAGS